jgi:succinoglycan biosynthesis protein ExoV
MKLYYFDGKAREYKTGNFGDDLNPWLWERLLPNVFDQNDTTIFVGIGTLLNERLPKTTKIIFGSGVGYGEIPTVDQNWKTYFVRGPLSARALGFEESIGLTDPAILVRQFFNLNQDKEFKWSYMPHYHEAVFNEATWKQICESLAIHYISPTLPVEQVISEILRSEVLLTEAMHGAIVADALRVPWAAIKTKSNILDFKWNDWMRTIGFSFDPLLIQRFTSRPSQKGILRFCEYQYIRAQISAIKRAVIPSLSPISRQHELEEKVITKLQEFKFDFNQGLFK